MKESTVIYRTINPATGEHVESYPTATAAEVDAAIERAAAVFEDWCSRPFSERAAVLASIADLLESRAPDLGELMAREMGKPISQGKSEVEKCAWVCRYYAEKGEEFLAPQSHESDGSEAFVRYDALGPILAIMPWNFPFWQVFRFAAPAFAAGNVALLKHAPNTPGCAREIGELVRDAGAPEGLLQSLYLSNEQAGEIIGRRELRGVTLTGSSQAGRAVAAIAGSHLKPVVLELGGSDAFVVFADADLDKATEVGVTSRCLNSGQSCIAAKRFLVEESVFDEFCHRFVSRMETQKVGDPLAPETLIGPLAREDLRDRLHRQVRESLSRGAQALCGGAPLSGRGFFYPPTVLVDVRDGMPAFREELFGPVAVLLPFRDENEAVTLANRTEYGLGASLWSSNRERIERLLPRMEVGSVFVNGLVKSDPRLPFGGVKDSGFGRELSREGLLEFVNVKTVWVA